MRPGPEDEISQAEKRRIIREQGSTFHQYDAVAEASIETGRFSQINAAHVIGSSPNPSSQYPAAAAHQHDPVPPEPPTGYDVNEMPPLEPSTDSSSLAAVEETGGAPSSAPPDNVAAPLPSSKG
jgi:hypothetical protein